MDWLYSLFTNTESVGHIVVIYALVISIGLLLGRIKVAGISLGVTFVLFAGILLGHIYHAAGIASEVGGFAAPGNVLTFIQDFGLILFVYCIGLQVGPGFFESFKTGGLKMNAIAVGIILLGDLSFSELLPFGGILHPVLVIEISQLFSQFSLRSAVG